MILTVIIAISIFQVGIYLLLDLRHQGNLKIFVLLLVLLSYFFFLPPLFYPQINPNGVNCGMPILGITLAFWIFGSLISTVSHLAYLFFKQVAKDFVI